MGGEVSGVVGDRQVRRGMAGVTNCVTNARFYLQQMVSGEDVKLLHVSLDTGPAQLIVLLYSRLESLSMRGEPGRLNTATSAVREVSRSRSCEWVQSTVRVVVSAWTGCTLLSWSAQ